MATIYSPFSKLFILSIFIFIVSCSPVNNFPTKVLIKNYPEKTDKENQNQEKNTIEKINDIEIKSELYNEPVLTDVEIILPYLNNKEIIKNLINSFELSIYKKEIKDINLNINRYNNLIDLERLLNLNAGPGKIFVGTLNYDATNLVKNYCNKGILFFSFTSKKSLAGDCVYLINFFPEDDLIALFNFFPKESKIALLYPENYYGYNINRIIDPIASESNSLIVNRASYKEDLSNAREAIKELGKYQLRKYELERQKEILKNKDDEISKNALKKIKKFQTLGNVDFTHLILPDYSIRLLEIAPLLPFYDVDPNKVQFVGTGVWDDRAFFDEPSLQGAIFAGVEERKRNKFFKDYENVYQKKPMRTSTIPYDLVGIISYILFNKMSVSEAYDLLDSGNIKFDGIDGKFYFKNNIIFRELNILKINNGSARKLN